MIDVEALPWEVVGDIFRNMGVDVDDDVAIEKASEKIKLMTPVQALGRFLAWNGIHGYTKIIWEACNTLRDCEIKE